MAILHHHPLDPFSRRVRLSLGELGLVPDLIEEKPGPARPELLELNPAGTVPVLFDDDGTTLCGAYAITEYLDELYGASRSLLGVDAASRAETRRLVSWFDEKFNSEVTLPIVGEKAIGRFLPAEFGGGSPDMGRVRAGIASLRAHLHVIGELTDARNWLAGDDLSAADLAAAAHLSCIDFLGDVPWHESPRAKEWYQRIKSRPSFRPLLSDHVRGILPPAAYADLDF
ncbi:MAG: glutathione S-transferase family protein [Aestuariivirgaceae bacterium]|nr:glutathione S-transferase family protein [Aestuariivirgaceae bacterium]